MRIAVIGAGMGGLAAACLLADQGHEVTVFDQFESPRPVGSGLVIQPVGQAVLAEVGALDLAQTYGNRVTKMRGVEARTNRPVLNVEYDLVDPNAHGLAIHRAALFDALWQAMERRERVRIVPGARVEFVRQEIEYAEVFGAGGDVYGPFELVVDSAGAGSPLTPLKARKLGYGAVWGTVDWPDETKLPKTHLSQRYKAASHMIGALPIGRLPGQEGFKAAIFWSLPADGHTAWLHRGLEAWKAEATALWPDFAPFVDQIETPGQMTMATYRHGTLKRPHNNRLVHIGDAAHQASPQLGQGANMALLDASALARALETRPIAQALPAYARARRWHVAAYQAMSWVFTPMYQSDSRLLPVLRDRLFYPLSQIPPVPRLLTRLVCGTMLPPQGRL